jgi:acetyl-CoA acyltransferase
MMSKENSAFLCAGIRTPFGRYGGVLAGIRADDLAALPIRYLLEHDSNLDPAAIEDVVLGCANQAGEDNRNVGRMAALLSGLPDSVPGSTVNRLCGSGMEAIISAARAIRTGEANLLIAGGVESMSRAPFVIGKADATFSRNMKLEDTTLGWRFINQRMQETYGVDTMSQTAENVAERYGISRADQDAFALRSQQRARASANLLAEEIMSVCIPQKRGEPLLVKSDEQPRPDSTAEGLARLKPVVYPSGSVTAGNASSINDGSAAVLLASESAAARFGLRPVARIVASATVGVPPRIMGIGPVPAAQKVLSIVGLSIKEMGVIELNEAFAAQAVAVVRELGLPDDAPHVNPNGGAIAIGHPLGASGARLILTAARQLQRTGERFALCTMCIGVGQGIATIIERV